MEEKKIPTKLYIALLIVVLCLPYFLWMVIGRFMEAVNYENRVFADRPDFEINAYGDFASDYTSYFNDNLPFRNALISLNSRLSYYVFHASANDKVVIGKDGWLFYNYAADGDPIACYQGKHLYSEEELQAVAENLISMEEYCKQNGIEFVVFVAPNKERVYPERMPDYYGDPAKTYAALQVVEYVREHTDIRIVYPYEELMDAKRQLEGIDIYYKTDTHWNNVGGYVGSCALLRELGIDMPEITDSRIVIEASGSRVGDLSNMLSMPKEFVDIDYSVTGYEYGTIENEKWDFSTEIIYHCENADERRLFVIRDSFFSYMSAYMGSQFSDSYMLHRNSYDYNALVQQAPDILVFEVVERYIGELGNFSIQ